MASTTFPPMPDSPTVAAATNLERNQGALVHYAAKRQNGEPSSIAFVESAANDSRLRNQQK
jgi:hypothetical protein